MPKADTDRVIRLYAEKIVNIQIFKLEILSFLNGNAKANYKVGGALIVRLWKNTTCYTLYEETNRGHCNKGSCRAC